MRKILFSLLLASVLASCAASELKERPRLPTDAEVAYYNSIAPEEDHIACFTRIELGSRFPRRSCYRIADLEAGKGLEQNVVDAMRIDGLLDSPFGF
ncbi:MAG: hypothetical protein DHS20C12_00100 [Pseudohongiella sp.]|nr:MAG: hypothetical protein DHS20C12_00100 [Pseudohongiella sp.]